MGCYLVFTDGSCDYRDRIGAYAYVIVDDEDGAVIGPIGEAEEDTTISRMELMGPIAALNVCYNMDGPGTVLLYSDSEYVVKGAMDWTRARNKHQDLWARLEELIDMHDEVVFEHVRGHAKDDTGHPLNEAVDEKAGTTRRVKQNEVRQYA